LQNEISVPSIPVGELDYDAGVEITKSIIASIPEYLYKHSLLEKRKPSSEQHSLQFIKPVPGRLIDFVHILRFDFKLSPGYVRITGKGDNQTFPGYITDRIRFKSRLVPVLKGSDPVHMDSLRLKSQLEVDTDGKRFTSVFFDEFSTAELSIDFSSKAGNDIFLIPAKIFQFVSYDYFTACMNIPDPAVPILEKAAALFEPLFFYLYYQYRERGHEIKESQLAVLNDHLETGEGGVLQKPLLQNQMKDFFGRYSLYRDDDLLLKGLRKIDIKSNDVI
jgi:hypothetical protein